MSPVRRNVLVKRIFRVHALKLFASIFLHGGGFLIDTGFSSASGLHAPPPPPPASVPRAHTSNVQFSVIGHYGCSLSFIWLPQRAPHLSVCLFDCLSVCLSVCLLVSLSLPSRPHPRLSRPCLFVPILSISHSLFPLFLRTFCPSRVFLLFPFPSLCCCYVLR